MRGLILIGLLFFSQLAHAGAWTLDRGHVQVMSGVISSYASRRFGEDDPVKFNKLLVQNWMEYGLTDAVTLFAVPQYVSGESCSSDSAAVRGSSASVEAGARILLLSRIGMLAVQSSFKTGGAFDMSVSASGRSGRQWDLRLLYGRSFKLAGLDAFFDVEAAERWIARPRPDETILDLTAGIWLSKNDLLLFQSFNMASGKAMPPYENYRLHKLQISVVEKITSRWSVQSGYFFAPAGARIVQEHGYIATIWYQT